MGGLETEDLLCPALSIVPYVRYQLHIPTYVELDLISLLTRRALSPQVRDMRSYRRPYYLASSSRARDSLLYREVGVGGSYLSYNIN